MKKKLEKILVSESDNIQKALKKLNENSMQILFVVGKNNKILGTITDGDIRRGLIKKYAITDKLKKVYNKKFIYINEGTSYEKAKILMQNNYVRCIPILNKKKFVIDYFSLEDIDTQKKKNLFLIMAGGFGKRLLPITKNIPKPMIKVGNKPILEHIINRAKYNGFDNFVISVHYLSKKIIKYFGDGKKLNVKIKYIIEKKPYGTAGALRFLKEKTSLPVVVCNGDVLSNINFNSLLNFHKQNKSDMSVVIRSLVSKNPFGMVKLKNNKIIGFEEKKDLVMHINAGIYVINQKLLKLISTKKKTDMSDYILLLIKNKKRIHSFMLNDNWIDIGTKENLILSRKLIKE